MSDEEFHIWIVVEAPGGERKSMDLNLPQTEEDQAIVMAEEIATRAHCDWRWLDE